MSLSSLRRVRGKKAISLGIVLVMAAFAACSSGPSSEILPTSTEPAATLVDATPAPRNTPVSFQPGTGSTTPTNTPDTLATFADVHFDSSGFTIEQVYLAGDEVYFNVYNDTEEEHQFLAVKTDVDPGSLAIDANDQAVLDVAPLIDVESILPGRKSTSEIDPVQPGTYLLLDNLPGHFAAGEYAVIHVSAS
jgi:hypothetical protein